MALPRKPNRDFATTASGRRIALPVPMGGNPPCLGSHLTLLDEARAAIRIGDLGEALVWIGRMLPENSDRRERVDRALRGEPAGDLDDTLIRLERDEPCLDGLRALVTRTLNGDA